jgi:hypothetical protein
MTRHGPYPTNNAHEVPVVSTVKGIVALATQRQEAHLEEERATVSSPREFTVRAITQKFERHVADRQEVRRQSLTCGSPVAERKKLLQQALLLPVEAVSETEQDIQPANKSDVVVEKKTLLRSKRGKKTIAAHRRKHTARVAERVADRMKVFEKSHATEDGMVHETGIDQDDATVIFAPKEEGATVPAPTELVIVARASGSTVSPESEMSAPDHTCSIFSDETLNARDEVEELGRRQKPDRREILGHSQSVEEDLPTFDSGFWLDNSFPRALVDIVTSFEINSGAPQSRNEGATSSQRTAVDKSKALGKKPSQGIQDMESGRAEDPSPWPILTSIDTEGLSKESAASDDSVRGTGDLDVLAFRLQDDIMVPFDELMEETLGKSEALLSLEKDDGDSSPSQALPNSSLFSTVEQFEEREKMHEDFDGSTEDCITVRVEPSEELASTTNAEDQAQEERPSKQPNDPRVNPDIHEINAMVHESEQKHGTNTSTHEGSIDEAGKDPNWPSEPNQDMSWFYVKDQFNYETEEEDSYERAVHAGSITEEARGPEVHPDATSAAPMRRYEIADEGDMPQIRGILKNRIDALTPAAQPQVSPGSSASWYSSATSIATSEVSQQLSPLQSSLLAVPILPHRNRFSIGACVNAHLLENPPDGTAEGSSQGSSFRAQVGESLHPVSMWPQRLPEDSANSSVNSHDTRIHMVSPSSMDPQFSRSHHDQRQESDAIAQAVTTMAKTASTVVLVLVEAADKVVVSPLLSVFNCVDQSESFLCQGTTCWGAAGGPTGASGKKSRKKKLRSRSRKFKA